ncbi:hypothetical protein OG884_17080 [Streptosporangium sp. NBC_01755]|uniref:hypothetical protein n=1 Tax=unclassified Streptosporangium TaxID=2632669 RepID=UPI002DDA64ED|nr:MULTISPECIES: hypothetical protein [unclassified Streptosporangium]WSA25129.1 hypothetical protein OIE13_30035 [Streptosporangium sp. NBC_01810]WSD03530.1 hypothetical protein OG884_17080 [Streptosporangium sp. NBC_01755]
MSGLVVAGCGGAEDPAPATPDARPPGARATLDARPSGAPASPVTGAGESGGLREMMKALSAGGPAAEYLEYGEMAHWRELGVVTASGPEKREERWLPAIGFGFGALGSSARLLPERTGIDVYGAVRAVSLGNPPNTAIRIEGKQDAAAIRTKLTALGAKPRTIGGQRGLTLAADGAIDPDSVLTSELGLLNRLNQVVVTDSVLVSGASADPVASALGGNPSLAADPDHAAIAECLGDVVAAAVTVPSPPTAVALYGVGLRRPAATTDQAVNVVCVLPRGSKVKETFTGKFTTKAVTQSGTPLSDLVEDIAHDEVGSGDGAVLRATLKIKQDGPVTLVLKMLLTGELPGLFDPSAAPDPSDLVDDFLKSPS